jgi:hypothetical protein
MRFGAGFVLPHGNQSGQRLLDLLAVSEPYGAGRRRNKAHGPPLSWHPFRHWRARHAARRRDCGSDPRAWHAESEALKGRHLSASRYARPA